MRRSNGSESGLTLIEMMVVVAIMALVASLVGVSVWRLYREAQVRAAGIQVARLADGVESYRFIAGEYPSEAEGLDALMVSLHGQEPILDSVPRDPWSLDYDYTKPGKVRNHGFDISSFGPDKTEGTDDDIGTWNSRR
ncbi:MAG: type II secretion system protein GspG [Myxococcota bacterium]